MVLFTLDTNTEKCWVRTCNCFAQSWNWLLTHTVRNSFSSTLLKWPEGRKPWQFREGDQMMSC